MAMKVTDAFTDLDIQPEESLAESIKRKEDANQFENTAAVVGLIPGSILGAADTVLQSVGLIDENTVGDSLNLLSATAGQTYERNKNLYRGVGDVATMFTGAGAASKLLRTGSFGIRALRNTGAVGRKTAKLIGTNELRVDAMHRMYKSRAMSLTADGATNGNRLISQQKLRSAIYGKSASNTTKEVIAGELFVAGFQNQSELFFPEGQSWTDVAAMSVLGGGFGVGVGHIVTRGRLRKAAALSGDNLSNSLAQFTGDEANDLISGAFEKEVVRQGPNTSFVQNDSQARGVFEQRGVIGDLAIKNATENLAKKKPLKDLTSDISSELDIKKLAKQKEEMALNQPQFTSNVVSIEKPNSAFTFEAKRDAIVAKRKEELNELDELIKTKPNSGEKDTLSFKRTAVKEEIDLLEKHTTMVDVNRLNIVSVAGEETPSYFSRDVKVNKLNPSTKNPTSDVYKAFDKTNGKRSNFGMADNGLVMFNKGVTKNTSKLDVDSVSQIYSAMPKAVNAFVEKLSDPKALFGKPTVIDSNSNLETIDFALAALKNQNSQDFDSIKKGFSLGKNVNDIDDVKKIALDKRFERWVKLKEEGNTSSQDLTIATNLRMSDDYGTHAPAYEWFEDLYATGGKNAMKDVDTYENALKGYRTNFSLSASPDTITELVSRSPESMEDLLDFDIVGKLDKELQPHSMLLRNNTNQIDDLTTRSYKDLGRIAQETRIDKLYKDSTDENIPSFLGDIAENFKQNKQFIDEIKENLPRVDQTQVSEPVLREAGPFLPTTKNNRGRHIRGFKDTSAFSDGVQRVTRSIVRQVVNEIAHAVQTLRKKENVASKQLYNNYHSGMSVGWKLADDVIPENGMFALSKEGADAKINKEISERIYGKGSEAPEFMPDVLSGNKSPLVMDQISLNALAAMRSVDRMAYNGDQILSRANGGKVLEYSNGHTIHPSRFGQEVVFITDETGEAIDHVAGRTVDIARAEAIKRVENGKHASKHNVIDKSDVANYKLLKDQAFNSHIIDLSDSFAQTSGRQAEGGRTGIIQGDEFIAGQLAEIEDIIMRQASRYTATEFAPELNQLSYMQKIANVNKFNSAGEQTFDDAFDLVESMLLNSKHRNKASAIARVDDVFETSMNGVLDKMAEIYSNSSLGRHFDAKNAAHLAKQMDKQFGYHPMKRTEELLLSNKQISNKAKNDIRQLTNKAGSLTQQVALKFFETGHAILTTASVMTTVPHSIAVFKRIGDETDEARRTRLGFAAEFLPDDSAFPNEIKLTTHTINKFMQGGFTDVIKEARSKGYLDAPMGEFMEAIGSKPKGKTGQWLDKVLNASGALSQGSENFARSISFLTAYELFNKAGKQGKQISMTMANDMANRVIADYRPQNKPELFRGVTGTPLGMFQSFSLNYFEKMYSAVEDKNLRELAIRTGTQSFMFGGASVAGFDFFNESVMQNWDRTQNPENYIKQGTEKGLSDLLLYGTLSNLPKMLGLGDGIALHTRGEIQTPKAFGVPRLAESPMFNFAGRAMGFLGEAFQGLKENGTMSFDAAQESLIMASVNRPIRGWLEIAQGYATNSNHDIVKSDTREFASIAARMVGLKTLREAQEAKALWNNRQTELEQRNRSSRLRKAIVAKIRDKKLTPKLANEFLLQHIDNGATPQEARRFLNNAYKRATVNKFDKELTSKLRSDPNGRDTQRLLELDF